MKGGGGLFRENALLGRLIGGKEPLKRTISPIECIHQAPFGDKLLEDKKSLYKEENHYLNGIFCVP